MEVTINGKAQTIADDSTVMDLLVSLDVSPKTVIVEHNGRILKRDRFADTSLEEGDQLELIQIVGGG